MVVMAHGQDVANVGSVPGVGAATKLVLRRAHGVIANSRWLADQLAASIPSVRAKITIADCGIELDRQYLAFPSASAPCYLVEDDQASVKYFVSSALVAPPDTPMFTMVDAVLAAVRRFSPWRLVRWLSPGRMVVGWRS